MVFGKIEYLNLLPFHIFMKRFLRYSALKQSMHYHRGVPAQINKKFRTKRVDAAFISSIHSHRRTQPKLGIIAKKEVRSVLLIPSNSTLHDSESATSNMLAHVLGLQGEVLIGDKALRYYLHHPKSTPIDLAALWHKKYALPFVFATLCYNKKSPLLYKIEKNFVRQGEHVKIPFYLLQKAAQRTAVCENDIKEYLKLISYKIDAKSLKSLSKFLRKAKLKQFSHKIVL